MDDDKLREEEKEASVHKYQREIDGLRLLLVSLDRRLTAIRDITMLALPPSGELSQPHNREAAMRVIVGLVNNMAVDVTTELNAVDDDREEWPF